MNAMFSLDVFDYAAGLVSITAAFALINQRWLQLPTALGVMTISILISTVLLILDQFGVEVVRPATAAVEAIDFDRTLMHGALSFLLFAGALQFDLGQLKLQRGTIISLSTIGVGISVVATGVGTWLLLVRGLGVPLTFTECLLFGAIIAPTDAVAVLAIIRRSAAPPIVQASVVGEAMFNDGAALFFYLLLYGLVFGNDSNSSWVIEFVSIEVIGGILFGIVLGWLAHRAVVSVENVRVQVLVTLAVVMGGYDVSTYLGISGPLAMIAAGLTLNRHREGDRAISAEVPLFWEIIDEVLNACLFVLVGLELIALRPSMPLFLLGLTTVPVVLLARYLSIRIIVRSPSEHFTASRSAMVLTWAGIRGGMSIALALGLPDGDFRETAVQVVYVVVLFSVLIQGATLAHVLRRWRSPAHAMVAPTV
jgi:CPA1 family monovalent cation:H+ antiporter